MPGSLGGASLIQYPLNLPAFKGLTKAAQGAILGPEWATRLQNTVLDRSNRVTARNGWLKATTTPLAAEFVQMIEFRNAGVRELVASLDDNTMVKSVDDGQTWTDITGLSTVNDPNMQLILFNNTVLGLQSTGVVITYNGTGNFADLAAPSEPAENVAVSAFGRIWAKDSATVVRYCALLDETDWIGASAGIIDLTSIWQEQDEITGIAEFNNQLVVFSKRNIVLFDDTTGSVLGLDPQNIQVVDIIRGIGCIARDSIKAVKGDIWFLDDTGLHSLGRLLVQKSNPLINISTPVQEELSLYVTNASVANVRAIYSPNDRFYLLCVPRGDTAETGAAFCFDTRFPMEDGVFRCVGIWNQFVPTCPVLRDDNTWYTSRRTTPGDVGQYGGFRDGDDPYIVDYESAWNGLENANYKMLKRLTGLMLTETEQVITFKWAFDFDERFRTAQATYGQGLAPPAEWDISEWNIAQWGGGTRLEERNVAGSGYGEYIKIGFTARIDGAGLSSQQIALYAKQGRMK